MVLPRPKDEDNRSKDHVVSYDAYGRKLLIPKPRWVREFLPSILGQHSENPNALVEIIEHSLAHDLAPLVLPAAERLLEIDTDRTRGLCVLSGVLCAIGNPKSAKQLLEKNLEKMGDSITFLTTYAGVLLILGEVSTARPLLEKTLLLDPNSQIALQWLCSLEASSKKGVSGAIEKLQSVMKSEKAWAAPAALAGILLDAKQEEDALFLYKIALKRGKSIDANIPPDLLTNMTGHLGRKALLIEALQLAKPHYKPQIHGLLAGKNIIHAHIDLGQLDDAKNTIEKIQSVGRPEWREDLHALENEVAALELSLRDPKQTKVGIEMLAVNGPLWLPKTSPIKKLFPKKDPEAPCIGFLGSSLEDDENYEHGSVHLSSLAGQLSRALPLWLSEEVWLRSKAQTLTLTPCTPANEGGFVLTNGPWATDLVCFAARTQKIPCDYLVLAHTKVLQNPWEIELEILRTIDAKSLGKKSLFIEPNEDGKSLTAQAPKILSWIAENAETNFEKTIQNQLSIPPENLSLYVISLEQALGVYSGTRKGSTMDNLLNLRGLITSLINTALLCPDNVQPKILLAQCLKDLEKKKPKIAREFEEKYRLLLSEFPLPKEFQDEVFNVWG